MNWTLVSLEATVPQPWRNGGGLTRELLVWPGGEVWKARLSVADVNASGPFSRFDRIERWFAVLEGAGVELRIGGGRQQLTTDSAPLRFSGEAPVDCTLVDGPTRDFNLMAAPGCGSLRRVNGQLAVAVEGEALLGLYTHANPARLNILETAIEVPAYHLAWCHRTWRASGVVTGAGALWLQVRP